MSNKIKKVDKSKEHSNKEQTINGVRVEEGKKFRITESLFDVIKNSIEEFKEIPWKDLPMKGKLSLIFLALFLIALFTIKSLF